MAFHFEIWDDVQCASGATRQSVITAVLAGAQRISLAAEETLVLTAARFDQNGDELAWVQDAVARNVVRIEDDVTAEVWEWRISKTVETKAEDGIATITSRPDPAGPALGIHPRRNHDGRADIPQPRRHRDHGCAVRRHVHPRPCQLPGMVGAWHH